MYPLSLMFNAATLLLLLLLFLFDCNYFCYLILIFRQKPSPGQAKPQLWPTARPDELESRSHCGPSQSHSFQAKPGWNITRTLAIWTRILSDMPTDLPSWELLIKHCKVS
jgi:hypothetical protein